MICLIYICEWHICSSVAFWQTKRESHLLMRVSNRLWAISDTSSWEEVTTCALYETDKIRTSSPKSKGSHSLAQHTSSQPRCVHVLLHASVLPSPANWNPWKKMTSILVHLLSSGGGHSWCSGKSLYTPNCNYYTFDLLLLTALVSIWNFLSNYSTTWSMNLEQWQSQGNPKKSITRTKWPNKPS